MAKKRHRSWELRFRLTHMVILLGVITGTMVCVFYLGFFSGQKVGFESALASSLANVARIPVSPEPEDEQLADELLSDVYKKLQGSSVDVPEQEKPEKETLPVAGEEAVVVEEAIEKEASLPEEKKNKDNMVGKIARMNPDIEVLEQEGAYISWAESDEKEKGETKQKTKKLTASEQKTSTSRSKILTAESVDTLKSQKKSRTTILSSPSGKEKSSGAIITSLDSVAKLKEKKKQEALLKKSKTEEKETKKDLASGSKKKQESEKSSYVQKQLARGWYAQVSAPTSLTEANTMAGRLRGSGFPSYIEIASVNGKQYYRVVVGPESGRPQAEALINQIKRESFVKSTPFIKRVK